VSSFVTFVDEGKVLIAGGNFKNEIVSECHLVNLVSGDASKIDLIIDGWADMFPVYFSSNTLHFFYFNNDTLDFPHCKKYFIEIPNIKS
jgi:hypothetical protein